MPFTFNGFPYGDFHQRIVKHRVYQPTWCQPDRLGYTLDLIAIQDGLLPDGVAGSISTLRWPGAALVPAAATRMVTTTALHQVSSGWRAGRGNGRLISLCLEPEPGCVLQRSGDLVPFFERILAAGSDERIVRRYLRVCHDVCHEAVMFEAQAEVLRGSAMPESGWARYRCPRPCACRSTARPRGSARRPSGNSRPSSRSATCIRR